jgi:PAS domain S-box-containing protein
MKTGGSKGGDIAKYKAVFEHSLQAIFISAPDGTIRECNNAAIQLFGYTGDEFRKLGRQGIIDLDHEGFKSS